MKGHDALPAYAAIALALLFPAYWVPTLAIGELSFAEAYRADVMRLSAMDLLFVLIGAMEIYVYLSLRRIFLQQIHGSLPATLLLLMAIVVGVFHATVLFDVVLNVGPTLAQPLQERLVWASAAVTIGGLFVYSVLGVVLSIALLVKAAELPALLKVFAGLLVLACLLQLTVVLGLFNVVLFPVILLVLAVFFMRGGHEVEVV
jgi:hypothetical protein